MQGFSKVKDDSQLPKIKSHQRIHTASDKRYTEEDKALTNRPLSNNCRTRSLRAFTTKSVKYESAGNIYNKKVEDIEKQTFLVDNEIKNVEDQIKQLRKSIDLNKKQVGMSRLNESSTSYLSKISSRKVSLADHQAVKGQLKTLETKILNYRNKIDAHLQKNKTIQQQIDTYRKEISTLKNINSQLQASFKETSRKFEEQVNLEKKLDAEIAQKTELTHRRKVQNMHQKAQMIKQYDVILKTIDKELNSDKPKEEDEKSNFYLTDVVNPQHETERQRKVEEKPIRQLSSGKKPKLSEIRDKLKNYEKQFQELKSKVGSQNIEEITKKFTEEYQNNFRQYNFINEMYKEYEQTNNEHFQLLQKRNQLQKQLQAEKSSCKVKEIHQLREGIQKMNQRKEKIKKDMLVYNKIALELKVYIGQYLSSVDKSKDKINQLFENLNDKTIAECLHYIYERHNKELRMIYSEKNKEKRFSKYSLNLGKESIDDLIEEVKKQSEGIKQNRLLTREQLQKNTIELKQRKLDGSLTGGRFKGRKEIEKARMEHSKKPSH